MILVHEILRICQEGAERDKIVAAAVRRGYQTLNSIH
jgi:hypothetical protein